jgi:cytoskeletal protein RodZ
MSDRNRNEFDFDDDDLFGRDDEPPLRDEDEFTPDFDTGIDEDMPEIQPEPEARGGNRTFIILAAVMIGLFLCGLAAILYIFLTQSQQPTDAELTATSIAATNAQIAIFAAETGTAQAIAALETGTAVSIAQAATQTAAAATDTPSPTPTNTPIPTVDPAVLTATQSIFATQTALALGNLAAQQTGTAIAEQTRAAATSATNTPTPPPSNTPVVATADGAAGLNATATFLAGQLLTLTAQAGGVTGGPTQEAGFGTQVPRPTALPDTGLFDEVAGGGRDGIGMLALAVVGLVGVIVISRRLRSSGDEDQQNKSQP